MALSKLPLQIRMSIRDNFDAPECALRQELRKLNSEVGYTFTISLAWSDIHRDLSPFFPDLSIMIPSVVSAITIYLRRLLILLQNDDFQEAFLDKMKGSTSIIIRVGEQKSEDRSSFDIHGRLVFTLPAEGGEWFRGMTTRIGHDLEEVFMNPDKSSEASVDWVDVPATAAKVRMTGEAVAASLPPMSTLSKPESLFPTLLPYFVIISASGTTIHIESAHQPTLTLLHRYLSAHVRKDLNTTTQQPYLNVQWKQTYWGSQMFEIVVELSDDRYERWAPKSSVSLVLSFLVGACGYVIDQKESGWYFLRRDSPFAEAKGRIV